MEPTNDIQLTPDTGAQEAAAPHPSDPQQTASGSSQSPGGGNAPAQSASDMTHGGEGYPGARSGGETAKTGETPSAASSGEIGADQTPVAGDTDPGGSASAEETGQAGDLSATEQDPQKNKGNAWNG